MLLHRASLVCYRKTNRRAFPYYLSDSFATMSIDMITNISMLPAKSPVKNRSIEITSCKAAIRLKGNWVDIPDFDLL
jgi:hypothetical protein